MNEVEYIQSIDAYFPYDDEKAWKAVIDQGVSISDNAAYMALYAICGASPAVQRSKLQSMLEYWSSKYDHPTKPVVIDAARAVMSDVHLPEEEILRYLEAIEMYPGLYNAAGIIWQAAPRDSHRVGKATEHVEKKYDEVLARWRYKKPPPEQGGEQISPE